MEQGDLGESSLDVVVMDSDPFQALRLQTREDRMEDKVRAKVMAELTGGTEILEPHACMTAAFTFKAEGSGV